MSAVYSALPLLVLVTSLAAALIIFSLGETHGRARTVVNVAAALVKLTLVAVMLVGVLRGEAFVVSLPVGARLTLMLAVGPLSMLFITLSAVLWLFTTVYAIGYLENSPHRARFFGFFSLCVASTMGIAAAGNLFTFFFFYELLTLSTYPLVAHRGTDAALRAARIYLAYTLSGGIVLLAGIVLLEALGGPLDFEPGGALRTTSDELDRTGLKVAFVLLVAGLGVKAALIPLHGWLPVAMVAPAPVSALLHAVAVVKAGAFGIIRVLFDVYGLELASDLELTRPLAALAAATILYGSVRALTQADIKRRLAFSTVSQVSYITLGVVVGGSAAVIGGVVHLVHQGLMKITLFFCAGLWSELLDIKSVDQLDGVGRRTPWTAAAFTVCALGMIGVPPVAGFVSKWYLGTGAVAAGQAWVVAVLVASTLLNAAYFLPVIHRLWFLPERADGASRDPEAASALTRAALVVPTVIVAACALGAGLLANFGLSPLRWTEVIVLREYGPW